MLVPTEQKGHFQTLNNKLVAITDSNSLSTISGAVRLLSAATHSGVRFF